MSRDDDHTWLAGINAVDSALDNDPGRVEELLVEEGRSGHRVRSLVDKARALGVAVHRRPKGALDPVTPGRRHQGVAARYAVPASLDEEGLLEAVAAAGENALVLVLDQVQDPGNLGACLRSAAAAGVTAVVVPKDRSAPLSAVARKAAAGGAEVVPLVEVTNLRRTLDQLKAAGLWVAGASGDSAAPLWQTDLKGPLALVLGGEEKGLRRLTEESCDLLFGIPMSGAVESLNVSVACGVCLFEAVRQRSEV
jgi:23S rRNA (guanosine2251-2'-O)-methyltransferase